MTDFAPTFSASGVPIFLNLPTQSTSSLPGPGQGLVDTAGAFSTGIFQGVGSFLGSITNSIAGIVGSVGTSAATIASSPAGQSALFQSLFGDQQNEQAIAQLDIAKQTALLQQQQLDALTAANIEKQKALTDTVTKLAPVAIAGGAVILLILAFRK